MDAVNEEGLVVRLEESDADGILIAELPNVSFDVGESCVAVYMWFAVAEEVEVGAVDWEYQFDGSWLWGRRGGTY